MALIAELLTTTIIVATRPFSLIKLLCMLGVKTFFLFTSLCIELVKTVIILHLNFFWRIIVWVVTIISLPGRILTALQREKQLEMHLHNMQIELENLAWDRKELEEHLHKAFREQKMMELIIAELEEEHDKVIAKIELLVGELQDLKTENLRLKEIQGKSYWSLKGQDQTSDMHNTRISDCGIPYGIPSWKSSYDGSGIVLQDRLMHKDAWGEESKPRTELKIINNDSKLVGPVQPNMPSTNTRTIDIGEVFDHRRVIAMKQSLFSAVLSLLVGVIIWQAEDPCMPLVVALFSVVAMSLKSVVEFFSTIKNRPASDAVALLSFNWFILGTLTYPTLPRVALMVAPVTSKLAHRALSWLGFSFS
ncbi:uncharacterized protein LOC126793228 [Argentina anserina]|uniref:uncharacterized protein LOC126793228 n=1 Tax=Argentina anserina TaxID=57926 RepID=UPI0021764B33|nr:uncharacterized protein LOC126793228 [Potentilla anserina]XP_050375648.1 uncharacterized protein LOC126793228 [Potentilla anserina]